MTCAERRDSIFFLAADQLETDERAALVTHLESHCPRCLGALAEAQAALASLALALEPLEAPARVRERLRARARAASISTPARAAWRRPALAAGVAALVAFGAGALVTQSRVAARERELARLVSESEQSRVALGVLASPHVSELDLSGQALGFRGWARMYWDDQSRDCYLRAAVLNKPETGRSYVLWFTTEDGAPQRGGVLEVADNGEATLLTEMPPGIDISAPVYVTPESDPSVTAPTARPLLHGLLDGV